MSRWIKFSCIAHGLLIGCWLVAPPPGLAAVIEARPSWLVGVEEVPTRASFKLWFPGSWDCTETPCPRYPEDTRWYRLVQEAPVTVADESVQLRQEEGVALAPPVHRRMGEPPLIYVEAAEDVTWGQVMASLDELQGAAGSRATLVLVRDR